MLQDMWCVLPSADTIKKHGLMQLCTDNDDDDSDSWLDRDGLICVNFKLFRVMEMGMMEHLREDSCKIIDLRHRCFISLPQKEVRYCF
jgi:hypothetical protein